MPNHLLVSFLIFPYFSLFFVIFHFGSIVTKEPETESEVEIEPEVEPETEPVVEVDEGGVQ